MDDFSQDWSWWITHLAPDIFYAERDCNLLNQVGLPAYGKVSRTGDVAVPIGGCWSVSDRVGCWSEFAGLLFDFVDLFLVERARRVLACSRLLV